MALDRTSTAEAIVAPLDRLVTHSLMVPFEVVVLGAFGDGLSQKALAKGNDLRQAFRLDRTNESLGVRVQIRASCGKANRLNASALEGDFECSCEERIAIVNQLPTGP